MIMIMIMIIMIIIGIRGPSATTPLAPTPSAQWWYFSPGIFPKFKGYKVSEKCMKVEESAGRVRKAEENQPY